MPVEDKCVKCSDENCLGCTMKNGKEECVSCKTDYIFMDIIV